MQHTKKRFVTIVLLAAILANCGHSNQPEKPTAKNDIYKIILRTEVPESEKGSETGESHSTQVPGVIDTITIQKLNEPLTALAAFYSAMGGTMCSGEYCDLTTALGLGQQGSEKHKHLITKYFPNDKVAETVVKQDCYLRPSGASAFSDYEFLTVIDKGDSVFVDYNLMVYNQGKVVWTKGPDIYVFKGDMFKKVKRNLWTFAEE